MEENKQTLYNDELLDILPDGVIIFNISGFAAFYHTAVPHSISAHIHYRDLVSTLACAGFAGFHLPGENRCQGVYTKWIGETVCSQCYNALGIILCS